MAVSTTELDKELGEILEELHEKVAIGWIKNDGKVHTVPTHSNGDECVESATKAINKLISEEVVKARGCVDCKKLRCENCERLWQT